MISVFVCRLMCINIIAMKEHLTQLAALGLELGRRVGSGSFAEVYQCYDTND
jgi:hypothetical protein